MALAIEAETVLEAARDRVVADEERPAEADLEATRVAGKHRWLMSPLVRRNSISHIFMF